MKQTTLFDYLPNYSNQRRKIQTENRFNKKSKKKNQDLNNLNSQKQLEKISKQKNIIQFIKEEDDLKEIANNLGGSWIKNKVSFGYTHKENIMVFSSIQDFKTNFFKIYHYKDFTLLKNEDLLISNLINDKNSHIILNDIEYNSYYLSLALNILNYKFKIYQHSKLKLLFLRNQRYGVLVCPKF